MQRVIFPDVSEILKRLKQAEEERARVLAERKRLEAEAEVEADLALAAQPAAAPGAEPPVPGLFRMDGDLDAFAARLKDKP